MPVSKSEIFLSRFHGREFLAYCSVGVKGNDWTRREALMSSSTFTACNAFLPFVPCGAAFLKTTAIRFAYKFNHSVSSF